MIDPVYRNALVVALGIAALLLIAYQGVMLWWTRKQVGRIPLAILVLRVAMIVMLVGAAGLVVWRLAGGM